MTVRVIAVLVCCMLASGTAFAQTIKSWRAGVLEDDKWQVPVAQEWLVEARVSEVTPAKKAGDSTHYTLTITHVYWGAETLLGRTFALTEEESHRCYEFGTGANLDIAPPQIWDLIESHGKLKCDPEVNRVLRVKGWPFGVENVELLNRTPMDQRVAKLREFALGDKPDVAVWAVGLLGDFFSESREWLRCLFIRENVLAETRAALDQVFCEHAPSWGGSQERLEFMTFWVAGDGEDDDQMAALIKRLKAGAHDDDLAAGVVGELVARKRMPAGCRARVENLVEHVYDVCATRQAGWQIATQLLESDDPKIRAAAAFGLSREAFQQWDTAQSRARDLRDRVEKEKDEDVRKNLKEALGWLEAGKQ